MSNVKCQIFFGILFLIILLFPQVSLAGTYIGCDNVVDGNCQGPHDIYYDGLVPCGKKVCKDYSEGTCGDDDGEDHTCLSNGKDCEDKCGVKLIECCINHGFTLETGCIKAGGNMFPNAEPEKFFPCQFCHFFVMLDGILDFVIKMAFIVAVLMLVFAGFILIVGRVIPGEISPVKIEMAWSIMGSVATGLIIIFASWVIVNTIFIYVLRVEKANVGFTGPDKWSQIICPIELPQ